MPFYRIKMPEITKEEQRLLSIAKGIAVEETKIYPEKIPDQTNRQRIFTRIFKNNRAREQGS